MAFQSNASSALVSAHAGAALGAAWNTMMHLSSQKIKWLSCRSVKLMAGLQSGACMLASSKAATAWQAAWLWLLTASVCK